MNSETLMPGEAYMALLNDLMRDLGVSGQSRTPAEAALGLSFSAEGHTCRLLPHPAMENRLVVEVTVGNLGPVLAAPGEAGGLHELINRLNAAARLEHDWVACVDEHDEVLVWTCRDVLPLSPASTQALLAEGLDRAQALSEVLQSAQTQVSSKPVDLRTAQTPETAAANPSPGSVDWTGLRG